MVYQWKSGSHIKADAAKAGKQFEQLAQSDEGLTPESVLNANRAEGTPLHDSFEWDDTAAAEKYRFNQAGHLIRCLVCVPDAENGEKQEPQRMYFVTEEVHKYEPVSMILQKPSKYDILLRNAFREFSAYKRKYEMLKELQPVFDAADSVMSEQYL